MPPTAALYFLNPRHTVVVVVVKLTARVVAPLTVNQKSQRRHPVALAAVKSLNSDVRSSLGIPTAVDLPEGQNPGPGSVAISPLNA